MSDRGDGQAPARSQLALAMVKGGLAFGAVWMLAIVSLLARVVFDVL